MTTLRLNTTAMLFAMLTAGPAAAHVGHVGEAAGHAHWIGLAAAAGAVVLGAWLAGKKGAKSEETADADDAPEGENA